MPVVAVVCLSPVKILALSWLEGASGTRYRQFRPFRIVSIQRIRGDRVTLQMGSVEAELAQKMCRSVPKCPPADQCSGHRPWLSTVTLT
jgi:hypothetical protein